jgi:hypothetical protein
MAPHTSGASASVSGKSYAEPQGSATKERWAFGIMALLEQEEYLLARVPERTDRITINVNTSTQKADVDLLLNVTPASNAVDGSIIYTASHYLQGSTFSSGTGGDNNAPNLAQAAMEAVVALKIIELDKSRNPQGKTAITRCTHTLGSSGATNATFSALVEFPIKIISLPGGGIVVEGADWLT